MISRWETFGIYIAVIAISAQILGAINLLVAQETYVRITGSSSTGLQTFAGKNGQIRLPAGSLPPFPQEGMIQNVSGSGIYVYRSGAWELLGAGGGSSGVFVQTGPTTGSTVTALAGAHGMAWSTSGVTGTIAPTYGVSADTVMQGSQQLAGFVSGPVGSVVPSPAGGTLAVGDLLYISSISPTPTVSRLSAGSPGQYFKMGATIPGWETSVASSTPGAGSFRNLLIESAGTLSVSITADQIDAVNASGQIATLIGLTKTVSITASGSLGLDTGSVTVDARYAEWIAVKSDQSASTAVFSLASDASSVTWPSGYSSGFYRRVGWCFTKHTSATIMAFTQQGGSMYFDVKLNDTVANDGCNVLSGGTSTSYASVDMSTRMPTTSRRARIQVDVFVNSSVSTAQMLVRKKGMTTDQMYAAYWNGTASATLDIIGPMILVDTDSTQKVEYKVGTSNTGSIRVAGYEDTIN